MITPNREKPNMEEMKVDPYAHLRLIAKLEILDELFEIEQECLYCEKNFICFDREAFNKIRDKHGEMK